MVYRNVANTSRMANPGASLTLLLAVTTDGTVVGTVSTGVLEDKIPVELAMDEQCCEMHDVDDTAIVDDPAVDVEVGTLKVLELDPDLDGSTASSGVVLEADSSTGGIQQESQL